MKSRRVEQQEALTRCVLRQCSTWFKADYSNIALGKR